MLQRGQAMSATAQRLNIRSAVAKLAPLAIQSQLVITHGNGPQVGLLALQTAANDPEPWPLDVLDAETEGMIGYVIEQEIRNALHLHSSSAGGVKRPLASILTMVRVDPQDPAMQNPTKFVGPVYSPEDASKLAQQRGWTFKPDGAPHHQRRVVPSPLPQQIIQLEPIKWLLEKGSVVIAAGGGGIPCAENAKGELEGVEAVIDKDLASSLLAKQLQADAFIMLTDVDAVFLNYGTKDAKAIKQANPDEMDYRQFAAGSMGPKVQAACEFAKETGKRAYIGGLANLEGLLKGESGTEISRDFEGVVTR